MDVAPEDISTNSDTATVGRIEAVPTLLRILCDVTGMGFAAVARVTDDLWLACAVHDRIAFGLRAGEELDIDTTLCRESRAECKPIVIEQASSDAVYADHPTPKLYGFESYVSVPIRLPDGDYFGNLCAIDPGPQRLSDPHIGQMFKHFADIIGFQISVERARDALMAALLGERARNDFRDLFVGMVGRDARAAAVRMAAFAKALQPAIQDPAAVLVTVETAAHSKRLISLLDDLLAHALARSTIGSAAARGENLDLDMTLREAIKITQTQIRIDPSDPSERSYWRQRFDCSAQELNKAIEDVGVLAADVEKALRKTG